MTGKSKNIIKYEDLDKKPLPDHTKIDYHECLAKIVLEAMFPNDFTNLEIKDKPDLQNIRREIGVEVTRAINSLQVQNEKLYSKIAQGIIHNKEKAIETINSSYKPHSIFVDGKKISEPDRYNDGILIGIPDIDNFNRVFEAFKDKIVKLNENNYRIFENNYLFVHSEILADQQMVDEIIWKMNNWQERYVRKFQKVFVCVPEYLYILNLLMRTGKIEYIKKYQLDWGLRARDMVIQCQLGET